MGGGKGLFVYTWCMFCVFIYVLTYILYISVLFFLRVNLKKKEKIILKKNIERKHAKLNGFPSKGSIVTCGAACSLARVQISNITIFRTISW